MVVTREFQDSKPRTWVQATPAGRRAFAGYLSNLRMVIEMSSRLDVAYYYSAPYWGWGEGGGVKSFLLFFDKDCILLPGYMYGRHHLADPVLTEPLEEVGLL